MSSQNWMDHFKDKIKGLSPNSAKPGHSLLWTAIKKNMIRSNEYMSWVQQNLQAITLRADFFLSQPITPALYKKWQQRYNWSAELMPIYEWDGVLYIGCLEKPRQTPQDFRHVFVYCPVEGLDTGWVQWNSLSRTANEPSAKELSSLAELDPMAALEKTMVMKGDISHDFLAKLDLSESENLDGDSLEDTNTQDFEAPAGMSFTAPAKLTKNEPIEDPTDSPMLDKTRIIEHTSTIIPLPPKKKKTVDESIGDSTTTQFGKTSFLDKTRIVENPSALPSLPKKKKSANEAPKTALPVSPATSTPGVPIGKPNKPKKNRSFNISPGASFQPSVFDILGNLQADKVKNSVNHVFNEMKNHFSKCMIIKINGDSFTPWRWDEGFTAHLEKPNPLPLQTPSIFRVPWRTRKAYHGYIVPNDVNEAFFDEWNQTRIPDHVTIVPIIVHDNVTGLLLGIANKPINSAQSLTTAENLANKLVDDLIGA